MQLQSTSKGRMCHIICVTIIALPMHYRAIKQLISINIDFEIAIENYVIGSLTLTRSTHVHYSLQKAEK